MTDKNPKGAGRKPNDFESKQVRVPVALIPGLASQIAAYKLELEENEQSTTNKTTS